MRNTKRTLFVGFLAFLMVFAVVLPISAEVFFDEQIMPAYEITISETTLTLNNDDVSQVFAGFETMTFLYDITIDDSFSLFADFDESLLLANSEINSSHFVTTGLLLFGSSPHDNVATLLFNNAWSSSMPWNLFIGNVNYFGVLPVFDVQIGVVRNASGTIILYNVYANYRGTVHRMGEAWR